MVGGCGAGKKTSFTLPADYQTTQSPSVEYRGIFINDEDWGLMPWSSKNYEPADQQQIGPRTNRRIFELLLRLRANTYWPAMHECTLPFFLTKGNREVAAEFGIFIGSSHCEPMVCSAAGEWRRRGDSTRNTDIFVTSFVSGFEFKKKKAVFQSSFQERAKRRFICVLICDSIFRHNAHRPVLHLVV